jgi:hypothetical protein
LLEPKQVIAGRRRLFWTKFVKTSVFIAHQNRQFYGAELFAGVENLYFNRVSSVAK